MLAKSSLLTVAAWSLTVACSDGVTPLATDGPAVDASDTTSFAPEHLDVRAKAGGNGVLSVVALTLRQGPNNAELYAALKNESDTPACSPAFSIDLLNAAEQPLATGIGGLLVRRFYRLADGSDTIAACVGPGDVAMIAITDLPAELALEHVASAVYWCNYWVLELLPIDGISVTDVRRVQGDGLTTYAGQLVNGFDVALSSPSVAVFPVNRRGRPLGVAHARAAVDVPAGGRWDFETDAVSDAGVDQAAYPAGGP